MPMSRAGRPHREQSLATIQAAFESGITLIDTADVYCLDHRDIGHNERLLAEALADLPSHQMKIATKGGLTRPHGAWVSNAHPDHLISACEASLLALQQESIFLYQLHAPDENVSFADSIGALAQLQQQGKIEHIGLSNVSVEQIQEAQTMVDIVSIQNRCNIIDRRAFADGVIDYCHQNQLIFLPYCPVGGRSERTQIESHPILVQLGQKYSASSYEIALAWLLAMSPTILPIPGASRPQSILSSASSVHIQFTKKDLLQLNHAFPI